MLKNIFNSKGFQSALPYIILFIGLFVLAFGIFGPVEDINWREFLTASGKSMLAGGIFTVLLKAIQFMGVFKDELVKVIYEPKYLSTRNDLPELWQKMSTVLFKNKFPLISNKLLKDVKETYFPIKEVTYCDNAEHVIDLKLVDKENGEIKIILTTTMNVICESRDTKAFYEFGHSKDENGQHEITKTVIDGKENFKFEKTTRTIGKIEYEMFKVKLAGKEKYTVERTGERILKINIDNIYAFSSKKILNKLKVQIHFEAGIEFQFNKAGTIGSYQLKRDRDLFKEYYYEGLIYPEQGYYLWLKIKDQ
jgi:hypothetical protein